MQDFKAKILHIVNFESQKVWKRIINKRIVSLLDLLFKRIKQETEL